MNHDEAVRAFKRTFDAREVAENFPDLDANRTALAWVMLWNARLPALPYLPPRRET